MILFGTNKDNLPGYLLENYYFYSFVNNLSKLLCNINVLDIFSMFDFATIQFVSRTEL